MMKPGEWEDAYLVLLESADEVCPCCAQRVSRDPKVIAPHVLAHRPTRIRALVEMGGIRLEIETGAEWHDLPGDLVVAWGVTSLAGDLLWFDRFLAAPIRQGDTATVSP